MADLSHGWQQKASLFKDRAAASLPPQIAADGKCGPNAVSMIGSLTYWVINITCVK